MNLVESDILVTLAFFKNYYFECQTTFDMHTLSNKTQPKIDVLKRVTIYILITKSLCIMNCQYNVYLLNIKAKLSF
jgi:hypothetical protein